MSISGWVGLPRGTMFETQLRSRRVLAWGNGIIPGQQISFFSQGSLRHRDVCPVRRQLPTDRSGVAIFLDRKPVLSGGEPSPASLNLTARTRCTYRHAAMAAFPR